MRFIHVRTIPETVKHFMRHGLFPDMTSLLRALMTIVISDDRSKPWVPRFMYLGWVHSGTEAFKKIVEAYESNEGDLKASEYDPILQEVEKVLTVLRESADIPERIRAVDSPTVAWQVVALPDDQSFIFIYDDSGNIDKVEGINAVSDILDGIAPSTALALLEGPELELGKN